MNKNTRSANGWLWLTVPIAILLAIATGSGVCIRGLYGDTPNLVVQALGQDAITLVVVLPTLVIGAFLTRRGSQRARLVWLGGLVYTVGLTQAMHFSTFVGHFSPRRAKNDRQKKKVSCCRRRESLLRKP